MRRRWLIVAALLPVLSVPLPGLVAATSVSPTAEAEEPPSSTREYAAIAHHLDQPFHGYDSFDVLIPEFGIVALSHMASGLMNVYLAEPDKREEVRGYIQGVQGRALHPLVSPTGRASLYVDRLDDHNLYWSHLGLILGIARYIECGGVPCDLPDDVNGLNDRSRSSSINLRR